MNQFEITTAQNVTIRFYIANMGDRIVATLIDLFILLGYVAILGYIENTFEFNIEYSGGRNALFWIFIALMLPLFFYSLIFEFFLNGQTPGKMLRKIKVARMDGKSLSLGNCLIRWLFRLVDMWLDSGSVAVVAATFSAAHQRVGDMVAGTIVISTRPETRNDLALYAEAAADGTITFPQTERLSLADMETVHEVLRLYYEQDDFEFVLPTAAKLKAAMEIMPEMEDLKFLKRVLSDYNRLHAIEL